MAEDTESEEGAAGPAVFVGADGLDFSVRLSEVQRIEADPEDEDALDNLFAVSFAVDGPNADGSLEIMVTDAADIEVVALALDTLHGALVAWAGLIQRRKADLRAMLSEA